MALLSEDAVINLRSDTQSLPSEHMRRAMAAADLGDETYAEDPTVRRLEDRVAELTGQEAALLAISGTMANLVATMTHCEAGEEVLVPHAAHVVTSEAAGIVRVAGVLPTVVASERGHIVAAAVSSAVRPGDLMSPRSQLLWIENTHNRAGGSVLRVAEHDALVGAAHQAGLRVHLDGARLPNAAVACGAPVSRLAQGVDSVYLDFTKGLCCPLGAALTGSAAFVDEARRSRRVLGGGMRQAGVMAAAALVALDTMEERIAEDHAVARILATELSSSDHYRVDTRAVETNFVTVDTRALGPAVDVARRLADANVLVSIRPPFDLRLVTYAQIGAPEVRAAVARMERVARAMGVGRYG
jgi:threonine aldolase